MIRCARFTRLFLIAVVAGCALSSPAQSQDLLPYDQDADSYHPAPRYRESESHPLRVVAYVLHPVGWLARELFFRPLSYFASSTEDTREIMGYREPYDYRKPSCFNSRDAVPDCRKVIPFNYDEGKTAALHEGGEKRAIYFPDTNFDFDARKLNELGRARVRAAAEVLKKEGTMKVVLEGHTDARGRDAYNKKLGLDRAEAVKAELVAQGIPAEQLSTVSFGESRPLYREAEEWAYAANRRVEMRPEASSEEKSTK
jgi:outer membrane protein OmpA-like peptidoglycan-associated protein